MQQYAAFHLSSLFAKVLVSCADPGIFVTGFRPGGQNTALTTFFSLFLVLSFIYSLQMGSNSFISKQYCFEVLLQRKLYFSKDPGGSNFFQQGGGVHILISIETHIAFDFPRGGGGVRSPYPPSGSAHVV